MYDPNVLFVVLLPCALIMLLIYVFMKGRISSVETKAKGLEEQYQLILTELTQERQLLLEAKNEINNKSAQLVKLTSDLDHLRARHNQLMDNEELQLQRFEHLAQRVLEHQSEKIDAKQKAGMREVLEPLKEKIKLFEEKIEKNNISSVRQHESLKEQIKFLNEKSDQVSKDANNLVKALKGDYKKQGNWGELILESILDKSGLVKDREYAVQNSERNSEGRLLRPDVVINLPDQKKIVIDSKVSLVAYENMVNADEEEQQKIAQKMHTHAIKKHIDELAQKNYHTLYDMDSPDFVLMFIPIDTAFSAALEYDTELYHYAFDKNIVIVTSSTLLATLKTVESMWRNDKQNRFALQIAEESGKMYDKFVGFVDDMEKLGKQMNTSQNTFHDAMKKLTTGSGNLLSRGEKLKDLGAKAQKKLPNMN